MATASKHALSIAHYEDGRHWSTARDPLGLCNAGSVSRMAVQSYRISEERHDVVVVRSLPVLLPTIVIVYAIAVYRLKAV